MKNRRWTAGALALLMLLTSFALACRGAAPAASTPAPEAPAVQNPEAPTAEPATPTQALQGKEIEMDLTQLSAFAPGRIAVEDGYLSNAFAREVEYLLSLNTDRLLSGFRETAGLNRKGAARYGGWENSLIGGHTLGHYLTACVQAYESADASEEQKAALLEKITALVTGLEECQQALGTGYVFGATLVSHLNVEQPFDNVEVNRTNMATESWVPWYTMHKIFEGLVAAAAMEEAEARPVAETALSVASSLGDWVYHRVSGWSTATRNTVLSIEYGGMNDALYDLYLLTGKPEHKAAAAQFDQIALFERVKNSQPGDNVLNDLHANTTIPKFLGALKGYLVDPEGNAAYLDYALSFWELVVNHHTYITGGNSEWEHFGRDDVLDRERTYANCETCNAYNMLKMTRLLYMLTGDGRYADWYENTFTNSILSSQNPDTGMTTYWQPMAAGYFKVYGSPENSFWCCTGTGMENFTKLGESFYYYKGDDLIVNQYYSSRLVWEEQGVTLSQVSQLPERDTVCFTLSGDLPGRLLLRLPNWLADDAAIAVNGSPVAYDVANRTDDFLGYAVLTGLTDGSVVSVRYPMAITAHALPDGENTYAFRYGPVVLSALLGTEDMTTSIDGADVYIPKTKVLNSSYLPSKSEQVTVLEGSLEDFIAHINEHMVRNEGEALSFTLTGTDAHLTYVTHYSQHEERYALYLRFSDDVSALSDETVVRDKAAARMESNRLDVTQPGYGQYESDELHRMQETGAGSVGATDQGTSRYAKAGGSFAYSMAIDPAGTDLLFTLSPADNGKPLTIQAGGVTLFQQTIDLPGDEDMDFVAVVPEEALAQAEGGRLWIEFSGSQQADSAAVRSFVYTMKHLSTDTSLQAESEGGIPISFEESRSRFEAVLPAGTEAVDVTFTLPGSYAYLMVNGAVKSEQQAFHLTAGDSRHTGYLITVVADDFVTRRDYAFDVVRSDKEEDRDETLLYYVNCGDHTPHVLPKGDLFGTHNGITEQLYGMDTVTGYRWGVVDDGFDQYGGSPLSEGLYTANTWCYEANAGRDGLTKEDTNRYTKNQFENQIPRHIDYRFELEDGEYELEIGFADPWGCSKNPSVYAYLGEENQQLLLSRFNVSYRDETVKVTVTGGYLDINIRSDDNAINVTYLLIRK